MRIIWRISGYIPKEQEKHLHPVAVSAIFRLIEFGKYNTMVMCRFDLT